MCSVSGSGKDKQQVRQAETQYCFVPRFSNNFRRQDAHGFQAGNRVPVLAPLPLNSVPLQGCTLRSMHTTHEAASGC
jgi:hypothetical protein